MLSHRLAKDIRELFTGSNWTNVTMKQVLEDVSLTEAKTKVENYNTILALVYHIYYYIKVTHPVLFGKALEAHDKYAFEHPAIEDEEHWQFFLNEVYAEAEAFAKSVQGLDEDVLDTPLSDPKWGSHFSIINGIVQHGYYHLGQIVLLKKYLRK